MITIITIASTITTTVTIILASNYYYYCANKIPQEARLPVDSGMGKMKLKDAHDG